MSFYSTVLGQKSSPLLYYPRVCCPSSSDKRQLEVNLAFSLDILLQYASLSASRHFAFCMSSILVGL